MLKTTPKSRLAIIELAARYIAEDGSLGYYAAKHKAARHLGSNKKNLPTNNEIEQAVFSYQQLYQHSFQPQELAKLRNTAVDVMASFNDFNPRLVGPVLNGTAGSQSEIIIHLFSDNAETIQIQLMANNIPHQSCERKIRTSDKHIKSFPALCFLAGHAPVTLVIFPEKHLRQAPICPIEDKPMQRANIKSVKFLLQETR